MLEGAAKVVLRQLFESLGRQASGKPVDQGRAQGSWLSRFLAFFRSRT
jgi:2-furoyl-CoA dehydrogenase large subunit